MATHLCARNTLLLYALQHYARTHGGLSRQRRPARLAAAPDQQAVEVWRASNGPGAAPMVIGVRMELEDPLLRIEVDPSPRHMQGIRLIRQPERSAIQL